MFLSLVLLAERGLYPFCVVAPFANGSDKMLGARHCAHGRPRVRSALFMAALYAVRYNEAIKASTRCWSKEGSAGKLLCSMYSIIVRLNALVRKELNNG